MHPINKQVVGQDRIETSVSLEKRSVQKIQRARNLLYLNLVIYTIISIMEITVGQQTHSVALLSDGENNFTGIISALLLIVGLGFSKMPRDKFHLEGHWQYESLAVFLAGLMMLLVGVDCIWNGWLHLIMIIHGHGQQVSRNAVYFALLSGLTMLGEYIVNKVIGKKMMSSSLLAAAKDYLSDSATSFGTMFAIFVAVIFKIRWFDTVSALLLGCFIIYNGSQIISTSASKLSNGFDPVIRAKIRANMMSNERIAKVCFIDSRYSGDNMIIDAQIEVAGEMTVTESHQLCKDVKEHLQAEFPVLYCCLETIPGKQPICTSRSSLLK